MGSSGYVPLAQRMQADRLRFPGMLPAEILVLRAWLTLHEGEYDRFDYNMRIGAGLDPGPNYPEYIRKMAIMNSQKRLDAVGWQGNRATIIECKRRAGLSNIGQLVGYRVVWLRDNPDQPSPRLLLVTTSAQPDIVDVAQHEKIDMAFVTVDFSALKNPGGPLSGHKHANPRVIPTT